MAVSAASGAPPDVETIPGHQLALPGLAREGGLSREISLAAIGTGGEGKPMMLALLLLLVALLIWLPVAFGLLSRRPLTVLLIWLVVGPVISNAIKWPGANPFFWRGPESQMHGSAYLTLPSNVTVKELLEPTRVLVFALLAIMVAERIVRKRRTQLSLDRTEKMMALFSAILVCSSVFFSARTIFGLRLTLDVFVVPFFGYYLARRFVTNEWNYRLLNRAFVYLGLLVLAACTVERLVNQGTFYRLKGPFMQGAQRGSSILHIVAIVIFFAVLLDNITTRRDRSHRPAAKKEIRWLLLLACPLLVLMTWSRGNWMGLILGFWVLLFLGRRLMKRSQRLAIAGLTLVILPLGAIGVLHLRSSQVMDQRVGNVANVLGRFATWKAVAGEGLENPVLGIGLNNTRDVLAQVSGEQGADGVYGTVHNSFLTLFTELGVVGLLSYLAIMVSIAQSGYRLYRQGKGLRERWRGVTVIALLIAYLLPGVFANTLQMFGFGHLLVFVFAGGLVGATLHPENLAEPVSAFDRARRRRLMRTPARVGEVRFS
ncbi:MAG: O-antigen ligase family protein [Acidobacteria bacterium]|nr:MAG: O-antigen ligase family protein [Acidobacteriota bacterium]